MAAFEQETPKVLFLLDPKALTLFTPSSLKSGQKYVSPPTLYDWIKTTRAPERRGLNQSASQTPERSWRAHMLFPILDGPSRRTGGRRKPSSSWRTERRIDFQRSDKFLGVMKKITGQPPDDPSNPGPLGLNSSRVIQLRRR
ncbi:hypothetical protein K3722_20565 (plasmid) [Leisingera caerulea]|uniref:Uncharacterized protein n=1 Tax=Leisingera caerulea TaxID=506591 RepID=A0ABY5X346_LEICA|nr:hypothetical protein [Leisingera caerulea]UWQ60758.1 hypothetical protein K3722_20565 [Leisingera caerulea]